jgi:N-acetylmuramoyl-L-alanine amidase
MFLKNWSVISSLGFSKALGISFAACCMFLVLNIPSRAQEEAAETALVTKIEGIRVWHSPHNTRFVFDVSNDVTHSVFTLDDPHRVVVDISGIKDTSKLDLPTLDPSNIHVSKVRKGMQNAGVHRFVFDLKNKFEASTFLLTPNELYGHRLVLDIETQKVIKAGKTTANPGAVLDYSQVSAKADDAFTADHKMVIAIDAGHGGEDPGALGHRGTKEKNVTLSIAKKLKRLVDDDPALNSFMVRTSDYYVKLHKRRSLARQNQADMFISFHADAFKRRSANGFSVFALSQRGATSAMARALAKKENASDLIGGVSLAGKDDVLAKVLVDLSMTNTISESVNFGGRVLKELGKLGRLHSKRVEQAGFAVLKSPDIPSVLIETGFITNDSEERKLRTESYQWDIAEAVYRSIKAYYNQTPHFANSTYRSPSLSNSGSSTSRTVTKNKYHKVKSGESLSVLAQRYGTSMSKIKRWNRLEKNTLYIGQRLKVGETRVVSNVVSAASDRNGKSATHIVKKGESLSLISAKYNVKISAIKRANNLAKSSVFIGQKLTIPGASQSTLKTAPSSHRVVSGDTLSEIARRYGTTMSELQALNKLKSRNVYVGQRLKLPGSGSSSQNTKPVISYHKVVRGDTLSGIANRYGMSMSNIVALNNLKSRNVYVGQKLKLK